MFKLTILVFLALGAPTLSRAEDAPAQKSWLQTNAELEACMRAIADRAVREDIAFLYCQSLATPAGHKEPKR